MVYKIVNENLKDMVLKSELFVIKQKIFMLNNMCRGLN